MIFLITLKKNIRWRVNHLKKNKKDSHTAVFSDKIDGIFREETEAIVRRELALFILISLDPHKVKTIESILLASKDFDWEVKSVAFKVIRDNQVYQN